MNQPKTREQRIRAAVACPLCGAAIGDPCHNRGGTRRDRSHDERDDAWHESKRAAIARTGELLAAARPEPFAARAPGSEPQFVVDDVDGPLKHVELWIGSLHAATLHAGQGHMDVVCEPGWEPTWRNRPQSVRAGIVQLRRIGPRDEP